jgi:hypothetical protein
MDCDNLLNWNRMEQKFVIYKNEYKFISQEDMIEKHYKLNIEKWPESGKTELYKRFLGEFRSVIGHYFRNLYHVLKYLYDKEQEEIKYDKNMQEVYIK